ncbi:protein TIFY 5A [Salvia miltiorrhiza]|uniref:protein TIFY 5A n=1 Tax=Salvia miltiorrhiza TaxID=226208 RepID=UPI0025AC3807|nr:protein TIFY 5A [Salvia miltiorrhiza]
MKRNCNLELRLVTPSVSFHLADRSDSMLDMNEESPYNTQQLTIFYNGKIASCDATELQARAIISLASREAEEKSSRNSPPPPLNSPVYSAATGMSMKRSLKRFLEKRKSRAQSMSPYLITRQ